MEPIPYIDIGVYTLENTRPLRDIDTHQQILLGEGGGGRENTGKCGKRIKEEEKMKEVVSYRQKALKR